MSNNKQSSVEWLIGKILKHEMTFFGTASIPLYIIEQAKAMHKEEITDAWMKGYDSDCLSEQEERLFAEQYYNETFNTKEK